MTALTDYRVVEVSILGNRGGLHSEWAIWTGPYHREVARFTTRREALDELAYLVNEAHRAASNQDTKHP